MAVVLRQCFPILNNCKPLGLRDQWLPIPLFDPGHVRRVECHFRSNLHATGKNSQPLGSIYWISYHDSVYGHRIGIVCDMHEYRSLLCRSGTSAYFVSVYKMTS